MLARLCQGIPDHRSARAESLLLLLLTANPGRRLPPNPPFQRLHRLYRSQARSRDFLEILAFPAFSRQNDDADRPHYETGALFSGRSGISRIKRQARKSTTTFLRPLSIMTEQDAILAAICANPAEDTPRLAFADWMEEHGDPVRAAFIRRQIEFNRAGRMGSAHLPISEVRKALNYPIWELTDDWLLNAAEIWSENTLDRGVRWHRGFVSTIRCSLRTYVSLGRALRVHPITRVSIDPGSGIFAHEASEDGGRTVRIGWTTTPGGRWLPFQWRGTRAEHQEIMEIRPDARRLIHLGRAIKEAMIEPKPGLEVVIMR